MPLLVGVLDDAGLETNQTVGHFEGRERREPFLTGVGMNSKINAGLKVQADETSVGDTRWELWRLLLLSKARNGNEQEN
jgi:hypothetical protein